MANINLIGQLDLFTMIDDTYSYAQSETGFMSGDTLKSTPETNSKGEEKNYLQVEKKVLNLLKTRETKKVEISELRKIFMKKKLMERNQDYIVKKLETYIRGLLFDCCKEVTDKKDVVFEISDYLNELMGESPSADFVRNLMFTTRGSGICSHLQSVGTSNTLPKSYQFTEKIDSGKVPVYWSLCCLKPGARGKSYYYRGNKMSSVYVEDGAYFFARAVMFNEVRKRVEADESYRDELIKELKSKLNRRICKCIRNGFLYTDGFKAGEKIAEVLKLDVFRINPDMTDIDFLSENKFWVSTECILLCHLLGITDIKYSNIKRSKGEYDWSLLRKYTDVLCWQEQLVQMEQYTRDSDIEYARSFMTKKTISKKTLREMEKSDFNNFFGYVEYDDDCDTEKMKEISREWRALSEKYFSSKSFKDVSLRFRKLRNHRATGLYYTRLRCICVDIRDASSMVHEYMHMIDDGGISGISGDYLSLKPDFQRVYDSYCYDIDKVEIPRDGKYNADYFKTPTEVFARSAEIYVHRILGVNNSLVGECNGFAYPDSEYFNKLVKDYFDNIFMVVFGYEREEAVHEESKCEITDTQVYSKVSNPGSL
jgi:hypothetical protein